MAQANKYEIEIRVSKHGREARIVTRIERAYSPMDALMQASINHTSANPEETVETFIRVEPPLDETPPLVNLGALLGTLFPQARQKKP